MVDWIGQKLGNYQLTQLIGQGGFADVYLGEHIYLQTPAAIKILHMHLANETLEKFLQEARIIARLSHPNIIPVLEFGIEGTTPYLVMAYAPHGTLRQRHPLGTQIPLPTLLPYVNQMASALQYAHEKLIIHRDVKPGNMLIGQNNMLLLSDFGIATTTSSATAQHETAQMIGTTIYMSPEQFSGKASAASDQYALGIIIYEWLSGVPPFNGSTMEIAVQHMQTPPPSLREKIPSLSPLVESVIMRALAKEPQARYPRIQNFAEALELAAAQPVSRSSFQTPSRQLFLPATSNMPSQPRSNSGLLSGEYASATIAGSPFPGPQPVTTNPRITGAPQFQAPIRPAITRNLQSPPPPSFISPPPLQTGGARLSRRQMVIGLGAAAIAVSLVAAASAEAIWNGVTQSSSQANTDPSPTSVRPTATTAPTPTATSTPDATATAQAATIQTIINATNSRPTLISRSPGFIDTLIRGADNTLWHRSYDGSWHPWETLGESLTYDPVGTSSSAGVFDLFVRSASSSLQHKLIDGTPRNWDDLSGVITSDPAAVAQSPGLLDAFARGLDNQLWQRSFDGATWHDWAPLGGQLASGPTVTSWAPGRMDVFVRAMDNTLGHTWFDGNWHPWESLGGSFVGTPSATSRGPNLLDVFVLSPSNTLQHLSFNGSAWLPWEDLGGTFATVSPSAVAWSTNQIEVSLRRTDNVLGHVWFDGAWHPWTAIS
ncbi:protein kinase domain-containing protein [Tengunoibacter tsumagoiensis]|uniref:non-specific serine/threonine protein kinase n=1 Tax=Tengunoibacter tsumagoiensis TaxID=2014871 RepID=A0A401ZXB6_9CHLR|nr:protein kinase [Tengunoibacter tsumagoiensis]GCE11498.1 hypothetical protein KTT_13570 [Tengunoibacter tsumagoiensis]